MTLLGETQSGVDKHLETKVLDTGSIEDERLSRARLYSLEQSSTLLTT